MTSNRAQTSDTAPGLLEVINNALHKSKHIDVTTWSKMTLFEWVETLLEAFPDVDRYRADEENVQKVRCSRLIRYRRLSFACQIHTILHKLGERGESPSEAVLSEADSDTPVLPRLTPLTCSLACRTGQISWC